MPYLRVESAPAIDAAKAEKLQKEIGSLISIIPGKNIDNCLIELNGGRSMFISGKPVNAVYCEIHLLGAAPKENKSELCAKLNELFTAELHAEKVTLNIFELEEWGMGPTYRC